jgi:hypothetical protein
MNQEDNIPVYKDEFLLKVIGRFSELQTEEVGFLLNKEIVNEQGRSMSDVSKDLIALYNETNKYLASKYPSNKVAELWIATNAFHAECLKEML